MKESNKKADTIFMNGNIFNPLTCEWIKEDLAVKSGNIIGTGTGYSGISEIDLRSSYVVPGFIDAHVHLESSLLTPYEYSRLVTKHGTTSVIADPHELANVCGVAGIDYILKTNQDIPLDIFVMLPSCVVNSDISECFETISAEKLSPFLDKKNVKGIGELMNVPGVVEGDEIIRDIMALSEIRDGHAPFLSGSLLDRYIEAGVQSDHETIEYKEGLEKLQKGMYLYIREGSTEKNLKTLIPLVNPYSSMRCCFCTDDRHTDMLVNSGHIDDCIRKAIEEGCETEIAYRMATISPAERFRLNDRGALTPGRKADFSVIDDIKKCNIKLTYKDGNLILSDNYKRHKDNKIPGYPFFARVPDKEEIKIHGNGLARIVQIQKGQISTKKILTEISGDQIPDIKHDILKVVVVSRYNMNHIGIGLVQGLGLKSGAIASSVSHDSHNIIASGVSDYEIISAIKSVVKYNGAMVINEDEQKEILPLELAGLMSLSPYEVVNKKIGILNDMASRCGAISDPFMYLSFLSLTPIPEIRITSKGVFDFNSYSIVPLFDN